MCIVTACTLQLVSLVLGVPWYYVRRMAAYTRRRRKVHGVQCRYTIMYVYVRYIPLVGQPIRALTRRIVVLVVVYQRHVGRLFPESRFSYYPILVGNTPHTRIGIRHRGHRKAQFIRVLVYRKGIRLSTST